jgi:hypothetical protein
MLSRLKVLFLALMLILYNTTQVSPQNKTDIFARIEKLVSDSQPDWKLTKKRAFKNNKYRHYSWEKGESSLDVLIFVGDSPEQALSRFKTLSPEFREDGINITILKATVPGLGDENYLWEGNPNERLFGIDFRKGKLVFHIGASSISIAEKFALQIADEIATN